MSRPEPTTRSAQKNAVDHAVARWRDVDVSEFEAILARSRTGPLTDDDINTLRSAVTTLAFIGQQLDEKGASVQRLRRILFGTTEKTSSVLGRPENSSPPSDADAERVSSNGTNNAKDDVGQGKRKGHGRNGAAAYTGAERVAVPHPTLNAGGACPGCSRGKVYPMKEPASLVRVRGMAPLTATVFNCDRLRCNGCGEVFTAPAPDGSGKEKYDETATAMVGVLRYGIGVAFNRIENLQAATGIPLPASTQWDLVERRAEALEPAYDELMRQAAQGEVLHNDDTAMKVLALMGQSRESALATAVSEDDEELAKRNGVRTTGIVSRVQEHTVSLFFTGRKHAGENLETVLQERNHKLPPPIQMSDGLSHNTDGDFASIEANCLTHARRYFVDVVDSFPPECTYVIETLREVYGHDAKARAQSMSPQQRLRLHQEKSGPLMEKLKAWMRQKLDGHEVEPNSGLGEAMRYMLKRWEPLTLFLRQPGAPLDNNLCERSLKKAILHRKNSLFYKTLYGARVGDLYMSLIHTAELNGVDPFAYLVALMRHAADVRAHPCKWLPWNYLDNPVVTSDAAIATGPGPSAG